MKHNVYAVRNLLSGISSGLYLFPTDALASVDLAVNLAPRQYQSNEDKIKFLTNELQLVNVGVFDIETNELHSVPPTVIPWDFRRFIESPMTNRTGTVEQIEQEFRSSTSDIK